MLDKTKHRLHLIKLLTAIYKDTTLASNLGFKGGTAAYLFYDLPRFSTDLDFDIVGTMTSEEIGQQLTKAIGEEYTIKDQADKFNTLLWELNYEVGFTSIKIEISKRDSSRYQYATKSLYGNNVNVITPTSMIVQKMLAIPGRPQLANRDLFDLHYFLGASYGNNLDYKFIETIVGKSAQQFFTELLEFLENLPSNLDVLIGLGEVLDEAQRKWAKTSLVVELKQQVQMHIDSL